MAISSGTAQAGVSWGFTINKANPGQNDTQALQSKSSQTSFTSIGAGINAFSEIYAATRSLAAGANETLDLYGSLVNQLGDTINFARVKVISIELLNSTTASTITAGNAASNPFVGPLAGTTPTETIANGGFWMNGRADATGWPVTNASNDNLKILNNDGSNVATYRITLMGSIT